ncbi:MAG: hypothetical protein P8X91_09750 [Candidatus Bathyarchaeota archaeon]
MDFCSICGTRLTYDSHGNKKLYCLKCKKKFETPVDEIGKKSLNDQSKSKKIDDKGIVILDKKTLKLRTLPRVDADCYKCNCKKAETWTLNMGSEDNSQAIFFRCVSCGHTWRQTE